MGADDTARLIKELDGSTVLAEAEVPQVFGRPYELALDVEGENLRASIGGEVLFEVVDRHRALASGAVAFVCEEGCMTSESLEVTALGNRRLPVA